MSPTWYDVLGVEPGADADTIRAAWRTAIADLEPGDRRFATLNEAAAVLLEPARRSAYDAELAPAEPVPVEPEPVEAGAVEPEPGSTAPSAEPSGAPYLVPVWVLATVGVIAAAAVVLAVILGSRPAPEAIVRDTVHLASGSKTTDIEQSAISAQAAATEAIAPVLSYDYRHLDADKAHAESFLTDAYRKTYEKNFDGAVRANALQGQFVITTTFINSAIVRVDGARVQVLVFFNQSRSYKGSTTPAEFQDQVTMTMQHVGGRWLVDNLTISQPS